MTRPETARKEHADPAARDVSAGDFATTERLLIRASAGTGKTFQLSNRYLSLLRRTSPDRILAVTFTRKAAGEILDRILTRLAKAVLEPARRAELSAFLGGPELSEAEAKSLLRTLVRQLHRVKVSTLDAFFSRLATSIPLEIGLPPGWSIADDAAGRQLKLKAIDSVLSQSSESDTRRLVHLLAKGGQPRGIARLLTDTVSDFYAVFRASDRGAWLRIVPPPPLSIDELAAELEQLAAIHGGHLRNALTKDAAKCRSSDWDNLLDAGPAKKLLEGETEFYKKPFPKDVLAAYDRVMQQVRAVLFRAWADQIAAVHELLTAYDSARRSIQLDSQKFGFDDVAFALAQRMSAVDSRALIHRLDGDIDHLLLDEFQDTSLLQWDVLSPYVEALIPRNDSSFFCVGDVKQAIYGWRGGVSALFDRVEQQVTGIHVGVLTESRRSAPAVINAVNAVYQNLDNHPTLGKLNDDVVAWKTAFPPHSTARGTERGYAALVTASQSTPDIESRRHNCFVRGAEIVSQMLVNRPGLSIGVLTRKNDHVGSIIHELAVRGVEASEEGGVPLTMSAAVQLIQSLLRFADHPGDTVALFHIAHSPLKDLFGLTPRMSAVEAHRASARIREEWSRHGSPAAIERWSRALKPLCNDRDWSRLRRLQALAAEDESASSLRPGEFARRVNEVRLEESRPSAVRVMTVHRSKGLEFDVVVLCDLECDIHDYAKVCVATPGPAERPDVVLANRDETHVRLLPPELRRAVDQQQRTDVHESLCVLYVAMTRAARALYMVVAPAAPEAKSVPKTMAGLLRFALTQSPAAAPESTLWSIGEADWFESDRQLETEPGVPVHPTRIDWSPGCRSRGFESFTPSQAKGQSHPVAASAIFADRNSFGMERGTLWHNWCQQIRWLDEAPIDRAVFLEAGRLTCRDAARLEAECVDFMNCVSRPAVLQLFSRRDAIESQLPELGIDQVECVNEQRFTFLENGRRLSGAIDRLVVYLSGGKPVAADVIDFKTDAAGAQSPLRESYAVQLDDYAHAVARSRRLDPARIRRRLVWLANGEVETLP